MPVLLRSIVVAGAIALVVGAAVVLSLGRVMPGVSAAGTAVGGLSPEAISAALGPAASSFADPAHAPGYVVPGRDVWATRVVYADGAELWTDLWYSHYAPVWGGPAR